jgi:hypothetical protein
MLAWFLILKIAEIATSNDSFHRPSAGRRSSFIPRDRTYWARRVRHDILAEGISCGLHRIGRLMRLQALTARPRRTCSTAPSRQSIGVNCTANDKQLKIIFVWSLRTRRRY